MKKLAFCLILTWLPAITLAKGPSKILQEFEKNYPPAEYHRALDSAYEKIDPSKLKGFVVVMKGGIPAERAAFYISWSDYDYRGVTINGEKVSTRRGEIYTYLQAGDVMAVSSLDHVGRTLYLKLISPEVYIPENRSGEKRHSSVTLQVVFKLPKDIYKQDDASRAMELLGEWFKPFATIDDAKIFASQMSNDKIHNDKINSKLK